jgi:expansin (peptidoglycan-binding protein)
MVYTLHFISISVARQRTVSRIVLSWMPSYFFRTSVKSTPDPNTMRAWRQMGTTLTSTGSVTGTNPGAACGAFLFDPIVDDARSAGAAFLFDPIVDDAGSAGGAFFFETIVVDAGSAGGAFLLEPVVDAARFLSGFCFLWRLKW